MELQAELACRDEGKTLNDFIDLAIQIDNLIRTRRPGRVTVPEIQIGSPEPMQLGTQN